MRMKNRKSSKRIRFLAWLSCIVLCSGLVCGCQKKKEEKSSHTVRIESRAVERGMLEISTDYIGTLSPNISIGVVPFVSANVKKVYVKVGDRVKAGQALCQLDDKSADLSVQTAEDAVNSAKAGKDAAELQTRSGKIQADSSVKTLKKTLKSYKDALKTAQNQKKKLQNSRKSLKQAQSVAQSAYVNAKKRYKTAENLLIQFESFLNDNPDCKTTPGLMTAASSVSPDPSDYITDPAGGSGNGSSAPAGSDPGAGSGAVSDGDTGSGGDGGVGSGQGNSDTDGSDSGGSGTGESSPDAGDSVGSGSDSSDSAGNDSQQGNSGSAPTAAPSDDPAKRQQAGILLNALNQAGLTVEYLSATGLNSLREDMNDSETAYTTTVSSAGQLDAGIASLNTSISQLKAQISATEDSLAQARKMADLAGAGSEVYDAQIKAAQTGVEAAKYQKDMYRLTSPIDGVVEDVTVKKDNLAAQGMAAFTIVEKESMVATFYVTDEVSHFLKIGDPVDVVTEDQKEDKKQAGMAAGHITMIGTAADPQKGLFKVEAEILSVGRIHLSGGTSVRLSLVSNAVDNQLLIPYDSVYYDSGQAYVYRIIDDKAVRTDISTGLFNQDEIVVTEGLREGDSIVTTWASGLKDGARVEIAK